MVTRPPRLLAAPAIVLASLGAAVVNATGSAGAVPSPSSTVFINEVHYDNAGVDVGEAIEIAAPAGTSLAGWSIVLYNGSGGAPYDTDALTGVVADQSGGYGTVAVSYPSNGVQNGAPDGIALVDPTSTVIQFLSYEGTFSAVGGAANGLTSTDIGVSEIGAEPVGGALVLTGTGNTYGDFAWVTTADDSLGAVNPGQTFSDDDPPPPPPPPPTLTLISAIQGDGAASPINGTVVTSQAVVTSLFTRQDVLDGFFVQEEDAQRDSSAATSEGLFVFCRGQCPASIAVGDLATVRGRVAEFVGMTQIDATAGQGGQFTVDSSGNRLPAATPVELPAPASTRAAATFEPVEGMIATFPDTLVLSEFFELARYGQVVLTVDEQPYQFTHDNAPNVEGYAAFLADLATRRIILDDDNNDQNDAVTNGPDEPYPYPTGGLSIDNRFRAGDTTTGLTGVLHWSFAGQSGTDAWRIRPITGLAPTFTSANPAPAAPEPVGGTLRVATFNVLNYFTTIDETSSNDVGPCAPSGTLDCRGADSDAELVRQRAKTVAALTTMDAHVVGLVEMQNDDGASTEDLVNALNAATSPGRYAYVDTGTIDGDAIKVALIYQPAVAVPVGPFAVLTSAQDPRFIDTLNRPALIQTFEQVGTRERVTVAVNHLKSKGSSCAAVGDPDTLDGQGNCAITRTNAAAALADYLATDPTGSGDPDVMILGDLNSYRRETPITTLTNAGYVDLIEEFVGDEAYSFLFDGQLGYLDHALATKSLVGQVTGVTEWAVNADEPPLFDYNDTVRDPGEAAFERESTARELYLPDARRSSDHNPLVVGLDLDGVPNTLTIDSALIATGAGGGRLVLSATVAGATFSACPQLALTAEGAEVVRVQTSAVGQSTRCQAIVRGGTVVTFDRATGALRVVAPLPAGFALTDDSVKFDVVVDGQKFSAEVTGRRIGSIWTY
ncbi:hypothetical protein BH18ACT2_BH18ACT2_03750 [soil metagenome]